jgi:hypothetical protein
MASAAQARIETLRWSHPSLSDVSGFRVYIGSGSRTYTQVFNAGLPPANPDGTFSFDLQVVDDATVYVAVSAYNSAGESPLSNEGLRAPPVTPTATPTPLPIPTPPPVDPGEGGSVFTEGFETSDTGQYVPGWVDTQAWNSMVEDDSLFSITTLSGNRVFTTSSAQTGIHSHFVGIGSADWFLYELRGRMRVSSSGGRLGVTAYSQFTSQNVYYRLGSHWVSGEMELFREPAPDDTFVCGGSGTGVIPRANVWYAFRLRIIPEDASTQVHAKVWAESSAEPAQWQAECSDVAANRPTSGTIGFWSGSTGAKYWDDLQVIALPGGMTPGGSDEPVGRPGRPEIILP